MNEQPDQIPNYHPSPEYAFETAPSKTVRHFTDVKKEAAEILQSYKTEDNPVTHAHAYIDSILTPYIDLIETYDANHSVHIRKDLASLAHESPIKFVSSTEKICAEIFEKEHEPHLDVKFEHVTGKIFYSEQPEPKDELTDYFYVSRHGQSLALHMLPMEKSTDKQKRIAYMKARQALIAKIKQASTDMYTDILYVTAISWMIAKNPTLFQMLGFIIDPQKTDRAYIPIAKLLDIKP